MTNKVTNKLSYFAVSLIMGVIILAFVLTGFEGFNSNSGEVADVGGTPVSSQEFNRALQMRLDYFSKQGKTLTNKEIRDYGIRESILNGLIAQKHLINFSDALNFGAGKKYIKNEIKEYKMFQTNNQFDVNKYKQLLRANNYSPSKFEEEMTNNVKVNKLSKLLSAIQSSKDYIKKVAELKNLKMMATAVQIDKEAMSSNLEVSKKDINSFMNGEKNKNVLDSLYKTYQAEFISKNPKKKAKSFDKMKFELAKKHLQKSDRKGLNQFYEKLQADVKKLLEKNQTKKLERLSKRYGFTLEKKYELSYFNPSYKGNNFDLKELSSFITSNKNQKLLTSKSPMAVSFLYINDVKKKELKDEELSREIKFSGIQKSRTLQSQVISHQEKNTQVTTSLPVL